MARKTKEEAEKTRLEILQSALNVFCEKGYSRTTFDEIAKRIGLTKGAVYWYFNNKPDIIAALIKEAFHKFNAVAIEKFPQINSLEDLKQRFVFEAECIQEVPLLRKLMFFMIFQMEWSEGVISSVDSSIGEVRDYGIKYLKENLLLAKTRGEIIPDTDIQELTTVLSAIWTGLLQQALCKNIQIDFPKIVSKSFDLIFDKVKHRKVL